MVQNVVADTAENRPLKCTHPSAPHYNKVGIQIPRVADNHLPGLCAHCQSEVTGQSLVLQPGKEVVTQSVRKLNVLLEHSVDLVSFTLSQCSEGEIVGRVAWLADMVEVNHVGGTKDVRHVPSHRPLTWLTAIHGK